MMNRQDITILVVSCNSGKNENSLLASWGYKMLPMEHDGYAALRSIRANKPHVVLCDAFLPGLDFGGILDELNAPEYKGVLIGLSSCSNDKLASRLMNKGADYFFIYPCDLNYLSKIIDAFVVEKLEEKNIPPRPMLSRRFLIEDSVIEVLHDLGMPTNLLGYRYIRQALILALEDEKMLEAITSVLYDRVAQIYKTKPNAVERAMRTAICATWDRGNYEAQRSYFGYTISDAKGKPTNGEFLTKIVVNLRTKLTLL